MKQTTIWFIIIISSISYFNTYSYSEIVNKKRIAIMDIKPENTSEAYANTVRNLFEVSLHKTDSANILERTRMETILKEQGFQLSGCTDTVCSVDIGKLLSADYVIVGTLNKLGKYTLSIRLVSIIDGKIRYVDEESADKEDDLKSKIDIITGKLARELMKDVSIKSDELNLDMPKNFTASKGDHKDKISLKWEPVKDAEMYYIFRSNDMYGKYDMISKTGETFYNDTSVEGGKRYYYKIRSGVSDITGPFSEIKDGMKGKSAVMYYMGGLIPGLGQLYYGNNFKGYFFLSGFLLANSIVLYTYIDYTNKKNQYYGIPSGTSRSNATAKYNAYVKSTNTVLYSLALWSALYIANWIDILIFNEPVFKGNQGQDKYSHFNINIYKETYFNLKTEARIALFASINY